MGKYIEICSLSKMNGKINKDTDNTYANMYIVQQEKYEVNRLTDTIPTSTLRVVKTTEHNRVLCSIVCDY